MNTPRRISIIDWSVLTGVVGDNDALRARVLGAFLRESERDLAELERALDSQDFDAARKLAHQLRGAARTVGALSLADVARGLESEAVYGIPDQVAQLRVDLRAQIAMVHERIRTPEA